MEAIYVKETNRDDFPYIVVIRDLTLGLFIAAGLFKNLEAVADYLQSEPEYDSYFFKIYMS